MEALIEHDTAGSPVDEDIRWTNRSVPELAEELQEQGFEIGPDALRRILFDELGLSRRQAFKDEAACTFEHRDEQFQYIKKLRAKYERNDWPVLSIDTKKKEILGDPSTLADNPLLAEFDYTLRADGKRIGEKVTGPNGLIGDYAWAYDPVGRLINESFDHATNDLEDYTAAYKFDLAGNRLEKTVDQEANGSIDQRFGYQYDAADRLLEETLDLLNGQDTRTVYEWGTNGSKTHQMGKAVYEVAIVGQVRYSVPDGWILLGRGRWKFLRAIFNMATRRRLPGNSGGTSQRP